MSNKKDTKLVLLTIEYPFGKGETFLENEIQYLSTHFKEVLIVSCSLSSKQTRATPKNVNSIRFQPKNLRKITRLLNLTFVLEFVRNLFQNPFRNKIAIKSWLMASELAEQIQPKINENTILYSYWLDDKAIALAQLKSKNKQLKVVSRAHRWDIYEEEHLYQYLPFRPFLFKQLNCIYSISTDGANYLKSKGASQIKISRLGTVQTASNPLESTDKTLHLISISYLIKRKRISLLLDAIQLLDQKGVKIKWTHFGDGPEMDKLKSRSSAVKHIAIDFKGFISNQVLMQWIQKNASTSVLINLSESEGIPVSMMEAMSFGIPCIGTDVGGVSEIIEDGLNGFLLPENPSAEQVADQLLSYYNLSLEEQEVMKKKALASWEKNYNAEHNFNSFCQQLLAID